MQSGFEEGLANVSVLSGLTPDESRKLARRCVWRQFAAGEMILDQEDDSTDVLFVVSGRLKVQVHSGSGRQVIFAEIDAGELFGDFAAIDGMPRSASVSALSGCTVARLPAAAFWTLIDEQPAVRAAMLKRLVSIVRDLNARLFQVSTLSAQNRVRAYLLRLAEHAGVRDNQALIRPMPVQSDVADMLATHRERSRAR